MGQIELNGRAKDSGGLNGNGDIAVHQIMRDGLADAFELAGNAAAEGLPDAVGMHSEPRVAVTGVMAGVGFDFQHKNACRAEH